MVPHHPSSLDSPAYGAQSPNKIPQKPIRNQDVGVEDVWELQQCRKRTGHALGRNRDQGS